MLVHSFKAAAVDAIEVSATNVINIQCVFCKRTPEIGERCLRVAAYDRHMEFIACRYCIATLNHFAQKAKL